MRRREHSLRGRLGYLSAVATILGAVTGSWVVPQEPVEPPLGQSVWTFDVLHLKNGAKFQGLLVAEEPDGYVFRVVLRRPGRPTSTLTTFFAKGEVQRLQRLSESERAILRDRLAELEVSDTFNLGAGDEHTIREFAALICQEVGFPPEEIRYDTSRYVGVRSKCLSVEKARRAQEAELALRKDKAALEERQRELDLEVARKLDEEKGKLEETIRRAAGGRRRGSITRPW